CVPVSAHCCRLALHDALPILRAGEVSEVSQDYLKAIWSAQEWGGDPMTATELANRFGTTKANVTEVLKRLDELELITRVPYRPPDRKSTRLNSSHVSISYAVF